MADVLHKFSLKFSNVRFSIAELMDHEHLQTLFGNKPEKSSCLILV